VHRSIARVSGSGFPPAVWGFFGLLTLGLFVAQLLTTTRMILFGRTVPARIVGLEPGRRVHYVVVEYTLEDGETLRSHRSGLNGNELYALATELGRQQDGDALDWSRLIGATVPVRYATGRPTMAHLARWVPLYRELVLSYVAILVFGSWTAFCFRNRRGKLGT
jgi:hypothetical protein